MVGKNTEAENPIKSFRMGVRGELRRRVNSWLALELDFQDILPHCVKILLVVIRYLYKRKDLANRAGIIGGSRGGGTAGVCPPPPTGSISFIFTYVFTKKCMHRRLAPPNGSAPPPPTGNPGSATGYGI